MRTKMQVIESIERENREEHEVSTGRVVDRMLDVIAASLSKGEGVDLGDFGMFECGSGHAIQFKPGRSLRNGDGG